MFMPFCLVASGGSHHFALFNCFFSCLSCLFPFTRAQVVIAMDFMEGGSLTDTLGTSVDFNETYIAYVCREILLALAFMHHQFRLHRDIKSDNVLVRVGCVLLFGY